jgi:hypothetical protein
MKELRISQITYIQFIANNGSSDILAQNNKICMLKSVKDAVGTCQRLLRRHVPNSCAKITDEPK